MRSIPLTIVALGLVFALGCSPKEYVANSEALAPTVKPGDRLRVEKHNPKPGELERFDLVAFTQPNARDAITVMRIIGLPGESIHFGSDGIRINEQLLGLRGSTITYTYEHKALYVYGYDSKYNIPSDSVFVIGDNFQAAIDSRIYGPVSIDRLDAKLKLP